MGQGVIDMKPRQGAVGVGVALRLQCGGLVDDGEGDVDLTRTASVGRGKLAAARSADPAIHTFGDALSRAFGGGELHLVACKRGKRRNRRPGKAAAIGAMAIGHGLRTGSGAKPSSLRKNSDL